MNTSVWGPPTWRILHGTSLVPCCCEQVVDALVTALVHAMPCKFCRVSGAGFVAEMEPVQEHVRDGTYPRWLYDLHEKVNQKLRRQHVGAVAHVGGEDLEALVHAPVLKFDVLMKRLRVLQPYFSVADVVVVLGIMAANGLTAGNEERLPYVFTFARALGRLLVHTETFPTLGVALQGLLDACGARGDGAVTPATSAIAAASPASLTAAHVAPLDTSTATLRARGTAFLRGLCSLQLQRDATNEEVDAFVEALGVARASACSVGVCH